MTWNQANTLFQSARDKIKGKPLGNNTRLVSIPIGNKYGIKLHNTIILVIGQDGSYTYNNGGWKTVTTKKRMNQYGPMTIYQRNHIWFVQFANTVIAYNNGMVSYA